MKAGLCLGQLGDARNEAALVRSAEAFGLSEVHVVDGSAHSFESSITRGADRHVSIHTHDSYRDLVRYATAHNHSIVGIEKTDRSVPLTPDTEWPVNPIFVTGHESNGLPKAIVQSADLLVHIEQAPTGYMRCLNTTVAGSIAIQQWFQSQLDRDESQSTFLEEPEFADPRIVSARDVRE